MRKSLIIIMLMVLAALIVNAQGIFNEVEIKLGFTNSNQRLTYPDGASRTFDVLAGSAFIVSVNFYEKQLSDQFKLQLFADVGQVEKGMRDKYHYYLPSGSRATDYYENTVTYFSLMPNARLGLFYKRFIFYALLGFKFDIYSNHKLETGYEELFLTADGSRYITWDDLYGNFNSNVMGFTFGGGMGIILGKERNFKFLMELRMDRDLGLATEDVLELENTKTWIFFFGLGYRFSK
ncbi:hypothetical protein KAU33_07870 [Candidatus Dependentiae bacterium]|nr:hypothetical protein [Candidatus Dependentiae bacterium]